MKRVLFVVALCTACGPYRPTTDAGPQDAGATPGSGRSCEPPVVLADDVAGCMPRPTDYRPREANSANDAWPACSSDTGEYRPFSATNPTVARVASFEKILQLLGVADGGLPNAQGFTAARAEYATAEGLDSRVSRREDVHYLGVADGGSCRDATAVIRFPDRCAGPAKLQPILNDAFAAGARGERPRPNAARIEAALLWFLYLSALADTESCAATPADCDAAWADYAGGEPRASPKGLGRAVAALSQATHDRAYDATLAVRCWRDLDFNDGGVATNLTLRDRARNQLDVATLRGLALVLRQRAAELGCATGDVAEARFAFLSVLLPLFDRAALEKDPSAAAIFADAALATAPQGIDAGAIVRAVDRLFPCP